MGKSMSLLLITILKGYINKPKYLLIPNLTIKDMKIPFIWVFYKIVGNKYIKKHSNKFKQLQSKFTSNFK